MERVTDYHVEAWLRGDLDPARRAAVEAAIASDPALAARVEALRADDAAALVRVPPDRFVSDLLARHRAAARRRWAGAAVVVAMAAGALFAARSAVEAPVVSAALDPVEDVRIKGSPLRVLEKVGDAAEPREDGAIVRPGATIQLALADGGLEGAVYSVDGRGSVTRHFPASGAQSAPLVPGPLPHAFTLDAVADFERFFLVTGPKPFDLPAVESALAALGGRADLDPALPDGLVAHDLLLRKVTP